MGDEFDPIARLRAEMDQARETMKEFPPLLWAFYNESVESGFSEAQAFQLTISYMAATLTGNSE
jgi:hypothetical protein